ncbi:hypothetical protein TNCV_3628101 [Trichonephila clavipes]|nr:hypothetical protein TNCV_3628101 [Trichonephila clavipes]
MDSRPSLKRRSHSKTLDLAMVDSLYTICHFTICQSLHWCFISNDVVAVSNPRRSLTKLGKINKPVVSDEIKYDMEKYKDSLEKGSDSPECTLVSLDSTFIYVLSVVCITVVCITAFLLCITVAANTKITITDTAQSKSDQKHTATGQPGNPVEGMRGSEVGKPRVGGSHSYPSARKIVHSLPPNTVLLRQVVPVNVYVRCGIHTEHGFRDSSKCALTWSRWKYLFYLQYETSCSDVAGSFDCPLNSRGRHSLSQI